MLHNLQRGEIEKRSNKQYEMGLRESRDNVERLVSSWKIIERSKRNWSKKDELEERNRLGAGSHGNGLLIKQALFIFHGSFYGRVLFNQKVA